MNYYLRKKNVRKENDEEFQLSKKPRTSTLEIEGKFWNPALDSNEAESSDSSTVSCSQMLVEELKQTKEFGEKVAA